jgi:hypothetical protein
LNTKKKRKKAGGGYQHLDSTSSVIIIIIINDPSSLGTTWHKPSPTGMNSTLIDAASLGLAPFAVGAGRLGELGLLFLLHPTHALFVQLGVLLADLGAAGRGVTTAAGTGG